VLAGTSPACELRLTDRQVSRRHVAFELTGARLRVTDLGSTNGTFVQGVAMLDAYLGGGELVYIGQTALRVDLVAAIEKVQLSAATRFGRLVGASAEMRKLYPLCEGSAEGGEPGVKPERHRARAALACRCFLG
jgi:hypothetical protein